MGTGDRKGRREAQAGVSSASQTSAGHVLSEEPGQGAYKAVLPRGEAWPWPFAHPGAAVGSKTSFAAPSFGPR